MTTTPSSSVIIRRRATGGFIRYEWLFIVPAVLVSAALAWCFSSRLHVGVVGFCGIAVGCFVGLCLFGLDLGFVAVKCEAVSHQRRLRKRAAFQAAQNTGKKT
jgi:hypothetical protein